MSVRRQKRRDPNTDAVREFWIVDFVYQHPDGHTQRFRAVPPVQTAKGAAQHERDMRLAIAEGRYGKEEKTPAPILAEFGKEFIENYAKVYNKPSEICAKQKILRVHLEPAFGDKPLDQIKKVDIDAFKARKLREGLAPKTINNIIQCMAKMFKTAVEWERIVTAPIFTLLDAPKSKFDFLTFDEAERLIVATHDPQIRTMEIVALNTGLRIGELIALRWEDVNLVTGRFVVCRNLWEEHEGTPKSGREREIPLNSRVMEALKAHRHMRGPWVFCNEDGTHWNRMQGYRPLETACRRAGLRRIGWHTLRHTFASHLVIRGVPLKAVQELLGHASIEMTMRYAHLSPDVRRDAVETLVLATAWQRNGNRLVRDLQLADV